MPGPLRTEAIVLRSIRYGEADRILHLYTPRPRAAVGDRQGRAPVAQPLRRPARAVLPRPRHAARGPQRSAHGHRRRHDRHPRRAARPCGDARRRRARVRRRRAPVRDGRPAPRGVPAARQRARAARRRRRPGAHRRTGSRSGSSCCSRRGSCRTSARAPRAASPSTCAGFSAAAGGVVCSSCEAAAFPLDEESYRFLVDALGRPLAQAPDASERALRQAERAISETAEHHAHVRLRPLLGAG